MSTTTEQTIHSSTRSKLCYNVDGSCQQPRNKLLVDWAQKKYREMATVNKLVMHKTHYIQSFLSYYLVLGDRDRPVSLVLVGYIIMI